MRNVFERFAKRTSTRFFKGDPAAAPDDALIVHDAHSRSPLIPKNRGIHIFRDPFALLLSHVRYHTATTSRGEPSHAILMEDGRTYGEHLDERTSLGAKAMFELDHVAGRSLRTMLAWDYDNPGYRNYPLDLFLEAGTAERVLADLLARFEHFAGGEEDLRIALLHFVATHIRDSHGTPSSSPDEVVQRVYETYPTAKDVEARLAAWENQFG